ncbi:MAG: excinuclease ABC subunit UvrA [Acidaminococcales bacterium]|jgi:excinuclease ABC subunit A|nr:excinuclease ABC subunit UvrA [Acidaminococcales bacterium]
MQDKIVVKGAKQHNLKNITVELPRDKLVVITGLSGSGKSSLAFDTIYAEGQRRYVESLSSYARQFLGQMDKPDVESIEGLSPAISIDQKTTSRNPRSTVGTVTEIYDYLRLLYARAGAPHCPVCGRAVERQSVDQIAELIMAKPEGAKFMLLAPVVKGKKGEQQKLLEGLRRGGYARVRVDGQIRELSEQITLAKTKKHDIDVIVDRLVRRGDINQRLGDSLETALSLGNGIVEVYDPDADESHLYSEQFACAVCGVSLPDIQPRLFSFNNPYGACPACTGLGVDMEFDLELAIPDPQKPFIDGGIAAMSKNPNSYFMCQFEAVLKHYGYNLENSWQDLPQKVKNIALYGKAERVFSFDYENLMGETRRHQTGFEGLFPLMERRRRESMSESIRAEMETFMTVRPCPQCRGARLKPEALAVTVGGKNIRQLTELTVREAKNFFREVALGDRERLIAGQILKEITARLDFMNNVGLEYLTLDRAAGTLSGGEAQRIRLATQIGSGLVGVLYILDEPSIGLHQRDNQRLLATLRHLRDIGNTLLVVEHDEETMLAADHIIDIGPGAGENGGYIVAAGNADAIMKTPNSVTGQYLSGKLRIPIPAKRRPPTDKFLTIRGASGNNLKNIDAKIPLGLFVVVSGVSGSGKSTLINDILYKALAARLHGARQRPAGFKSMEGLENIDKAINIDQSPIGRTPRSNPATYTGVFDFIRELFSQTPDARMRGYKPGRFSFNVRGGRCESCRGDGVNKIEMHFLPDVYIPCDVCKGARYNHETLEVRYRGKNIAQVLDMVVDEAVEFFQNLPRIHKKLATLKDVGLGYIKLGQAATTLSGGEAQRVKLAAELSRRGTGKTLYLLDEPTTGLHMADTHKLLEVLQRLVDAGDTVLVIEHNLDVIKTADWIIDLGPEGGDRGGEVLAAGPPEQIAKAKGSYTGAYLKNMLKKG